MPSNNFDSDIKGVVVMSPVDLKIGLQRILTLSNSASETGLKSARKNTFGKQ